MTSDRDAGDAQADEEQDEDGEMAGERRDRDDVPAAAEQAERLDGSARTTPLPTRPGRPDDTQRPIREPGGAGRRCAGPLRAGENEGERGHGDDEDGDADQRGGLQSRVRLVLGVSRASATTGNARFASWFQIPVIATARPTAAAGNPQDRSIEYDAAMPTAAPAGETIESAVDAWVIAIPSR